MPCSTACLAPARRGMFVSPRRARVEVPSLHSSGEHLAYTTPSLDRHGRRSRTAGHVGRHGHVSRRRRARCFPGLIGPSPVGRLRPCTSSLRSVRRPLRPCCTVRCAAASSRDCSPLPLSILAPIPVAASLFAPSFTAPATCCCCASVCSLYPFHVVRSLPSRALQLLIDLACRRVRVLLPLLRPTVRLTSDGRDCPDRRLAASPHVMLIQGVRCLADLRSQRLCAAWPSSSACARSGLRQRARAQRR
jgi:hypothetical protein